MTTLRRLTSLMAVIAMLLTLTAIPAFAVAQGTATITTGDLLSGKDGNVNVRITNNATALIGSSINAFIIEVPQDLVSVAPADVTLPTGWTGGYDEELGFIFGEAQSGSALSPGNNLNVGIGVTALTIPDDRTRGFVTSVSDNKGVTLSSAGSPQVTSRILELVSTAVVKPATATNADASQVTAQQDTASAQVTVINHGSQAREVTFDVVRTAGSSSLTATTPVALPVASGGTEAPLVPVTFGNAGSLTIRGTATTTNSAANPATGVATSVLTVQPAFAASFVADSLSPTGVAQGTTTDIQYRINKTAGAQPVTGNGTFSFGGFTATDGQSFDAANGQKTVLFEAVTIPDLASQGYATSSTITGDDANGAKVNLTFTPGTLTLDNLIPALTFALDVGTSAVKDTTPATTNGRSITYSGSIKLGPDSETNCANCTITKAELVALPSGDRLAMSVTNTNGTLSGSQSFTFPAGTTSAFAEISAKRDLSGIVGETVSNTVPVDLVVPSIVSGRTVRGEARDQIVIDLFDDGGFVNADGTRITDWSVAGNTVISIDGVPSRESANQVVLNLQNRLGDNATPVVTYDHTDIIGGKIHDRVSLNMLDQTITAIDGIVPAAPVLSTVNGLGLQGGEFYINDSTPDVALTGLAAGNILKLYYDTNDDGVPQDTELVYNKAVDGSTATVTTNDLGNVNQRHALLARMVDGAGNLGTLASEVLNLDFTLPQITSFAVSGQDVTVTFNEPVARGRNAAFDWSVLATQDGTTANRTVLSVVQGADSTQRVLTVNSASWDASAPGAEVLGVRYKFRGAEGERYQDRATNLFGDVLFTKE